MKTLLILLFTVSLSLIADPLPNTKFTTSEDKPLSFYDLKGQYVFASFVYSRCPMAKMCPLTMSLNKQLWRKAKKELPDLKMKFVIITLDPDFDTPKALKSYAKKQNLDSKDFLLLTGNAQVLSDFASQFNVIGFPNPDGSISHNLKSVLIAPDLNPIKEYKENEWKPEDVLKDLKSSTKQPSR